MGINDIKIFARKNEKNGFWPCFDHFYHFLAQVILSL